MSYVVYSADPVLPLRDSNGVRSVIKLERVDPLTADAGTGTSFDPMLATWIGGLDGLSVPILNGFRLLDIPTGTYDLYLYAGESPGDTTDFYLSVNSQPYSLKSATPTGALTFVANDNYVLFNNLVLSSGSVLDIRVLGFLAGLQLRRQ